ncbi:cyclic peptide export ABC transporter [Thioflexithrix psekupsensis]|uniref:cyclic peptide export ABC transporter n=1 Tax=Thioflexithrix psekupsensis TaxID=1570016 RepID=UPI0015943DB1|nr:cyclic peptide export ABC transporter [Thioflexithrix psekupsensis]
MNLLNFINRESEHPKTRIIIFASVAGISSSLLLATINTAAHVIAEDDFQIQYLFIYLICLSLFVYAKRYTLSQATIAIEGMVRRVRMRITDKIRHTELRYVEDTGYSEIYNRLSQDTITVSQSATLLVSAAQSAIMLLFCLIYIAWLSVSGFLIIVVAVISGIIIFLGRQRVIADDLQQAARTERYFFDRLGHLLRGFKEVKLNGRKSHDLYHHLEKVSRETEQHKINAGLKSVLILMFSQIFFYTLLAIIIFVLPKFSPTSTHEVIKLTTAILFIVGPLESIVGNIQVYINSNVAIGNIYQLEATIDAATKGIRVGETQLAEQPAPFERLELQEVNFYYSDREGKALFSVGPINLTLRMGEILFLVGGNGSGKSTLLKILTGLYYPHSGKILLDGVEITQHDYPSYRELFTTIFTDFHLFDRFYGLDDVNANEVISLIKLMELEKKTRFIDGHFSNINLSTGQRKRLAYIISLMENKQIYIFDEWAADQDPEFRRYFYEVLLQDLRNQGKTIIAVTHDDHYFDNADRVLKMDYGQLKEYRHVT